MKSKINFLTVIFLFIILKSYSQVTVSIEDVTVNNQSTINNCNTIDFGTVSNNNLNFFFKLTKSSGFTPDGTLKIILKYSSSSNGSERVSQIFQSTSWSIDGTESEGYITTNISASEIQVSGSSVYLEYSANNSNFPSCSHPLIKTPTPTFNLDNDSYPISCNSTSARTFTVNNVYNSPGTLSYNWNVGSGWKRNGSPVNGSFTTTTNSIVLEPNSSTTLPSNVSVTTSLDGVNYGTETATVTRGNFNPIYQITGPSKLCSSATYSINNLLSGTNVSSWSLSNTNIATISGSGNTATLTANSNGLIHISAIVTNACGQTKTITKNNINVGRPTFQSGSMSGEYNPVVGEQKYYTVPSANGATSYRWHFDVGGNQTGTNIDGWQILNGQGTTGVTIKIGNPGSTVIVCKAKNTCGNTIKYKYVSPRTGSEPCDETLTFSSNPMKAGNLSNLVIFIDDPCDYPYNNQFTRINLNSIKKTEPIAINQFKTKPKISIFNSFGKLVHSGNVETKKFDASNLKKGFYIVKYQTAKGKTLTKKLIVD